MLFDRDLHRGAQCGTKKLLIRVKIEKQPVRNVFTEIINKIWCNSMQTRFVQSIANRFRNS